MQHHHRSSPRWAFRWQLLPVFVILQLVWCCLWWPLHPAVLQFLIGTNTLSSDMHTTPPNFLSLVQYKDLYLCRFIGNCGHLCYWLVFNTNPSSSVQSSLCTLCQLPLNLRSNRKLATVPLSQPCSPVPIATASPQSQANQIWKFCKEIWVATIGDGDVKPRRAPQAVAFGMGVLSVCPSWTLVIDHRKFMVSNLLLEDESVLLAIEFAFWVFFSTGFWEFESILCNSLDY